VRFASSRVRAGPHPIHGSLYTPDRGNWMRQDIVSVFSPFRDSEETRYRKSAGRPRLREGLSP
jgi:hypothetical protein